MLSKLQMEEDGTATLMAGITKAMASGSESFQPWWIILALKLQHWTVAYLGSEILASSVGKTPWLDSHPGHGKADGWRIGHRHWIHLT